MFGAPLPRGATLTMILYEAFMRCRYCGSRVGHKLSPDEAIALGQNRLPKRNCNYCVGLTEWELLQWKGSPPQTEAESELEATQAAQRPHDRILVIDDDDLTAILLRKVLEADDCTLEIASDGKDGLQKLVEQEYSLVICDMHMPGLDGKQVFRFVDEQAPRDPRVPKEYRLPLPVQAHPDFTIRFDSAGNPGCQSRPSGLIHRGAILERAFPWRTMPGVRRALSAATPEPITVYLRSAWRIASFDGRILKFTSVKRHTTLPCLSST